MKKYLTFALAFISFLAFGQIETPAPSPSSKLVQDVGLSTVTIEYSRPGVKGRTIFDEEGLVPLGEIWRTGANAATKITFSDMVMIGEDTLDAGSYAILTTPKDDKWKIHFHKHESNSYGSYIDKTPDLTHKSETEDLDWDQETFTITVQNVTNSTADLMFLWENTMVTVPMKFDTDKRVMDNIGRVMAGPSTNDYYSAAAYLHTEGKDLNQALMYINKATEGDEPRFWQVRRKALILADMGKKEEAVKAAELSMELAMEAGNEEYVRINKKSIKEWSDD